MIYLKRSYMYLMFFHYLIIINTVVTLVDGAPRSPCPDVLQYSYDDNRNNLVATIQISTVNLYYDKEILLEVKLQSGKSIEVTGNDLQILNSLSKVLDDLDNGRPLRYRVQFPYLSQTPTIVTKVSVNGKQICYENSDPSSRYSMTLQRKLLIPDSYSPRLKMATELSSRYGRLNSLPKYLNKSQRLTRSPNTANSIYSSNIFLNPNNKFSFNKENFLASNNRVTIVQQTATLQGEMHFQSNPFLSNYKPVNSQIHTTIPQYNYITQNTNPSRYKPDLQNNPGYMTNRITTTTNKPYSNSNFAHNPFLAGHFSNNQNISIPNKFQPNDDDIYQISQITKRFSTTTIKPTPKPTIPVVRTTTIKQTTKPIPVLTLPTTSSNPVQRQTPLSSECGIAVRPNTLVMNGNPVHKSVHPWLAALFLQNDEGLKFKCGSTLISEKHVITAAHCIRSRNRKFKPEEIWIVLGRENLKMWSNDGAQIIQAESSHIHQDYKSNTADADIAIVILSEQAVFTNLIRPACIWSGDIDVRAIVNHNGFVAGWGKDEFGNLATSDPREVQFPVVSEEDCLWSNVAFREITSNRTFCAGKRDSSGPCNGDSGGGFVMDINGRWFIRGVVSMSLFRKTDGICDLQQYVVFVDIAQFLDWIMNFLK